MWKCITIIIAGVGVTALYEYFANKKRNLQNTRAVTRPIGGRLFGLVVIMTICIIINNSMTVSTCFGCCEDADKGYYTDYTASGDNPIVIDISDYGKDIDLLAEDINDALNKSDHIKIIDTSNLYREISKENILNKSASGTTVYKIGNIKNLSHVYGEDYLYVAGESDITIGLSDAKTEQYSITFGATYSCPTRVIASATWGTTKAKTLTYLGTWKVPAKHNGKAVLRGRLHMRPEYSRKQFTVYSKENGYTEWRKKGTAITKRAYGVDIYRTYTYR